MTKTYPKNTFCWSIPLYKVNADTCINRNTWSGRKKYFFIIIHIFKRDFIIPENRRTYTCELFNIIYQVICE